MDAVRDYSNEQVAALFDELASLLEQQKEIVFKIRSYRRAAQAIRELSTPVAEMVRQGEDLQQLPGVGPAISRKIVELVTTGKVRAHERAKAEAEGAATRSCGSTSSPRAGVALARSSGGQGDNAA